MKCFLIRTQFGLAVTDELGEDVLQAIRFGEVVAVEITKPRNIKFHRLFWGMVGKLARATELSPQQIADTLKLRTGHFTTVKTVDGYTYQIPSSISFSALDELGFRAFFNRCCREVCFAWLPHLRPGQWRKEVLSMMGIEWDESDAETIQAQSGADESNSTDDIRADGTRGRA